ncbi:MAG: outer membrane lipoprotein carrier protein LolA [Bacteroidales bacterium]|nr:outer membrane lipoprotein carrier protein LolA [Bacteroidales bacterium]
MKKILTILAAAIISAATCFAADNNAALAKIESLNAPVKSISAQFFHKRTIKAAGKVIKMEGNLDFANPDKLKMIYTTPATDKIVIDGKNFTIARGKNPQTFDTSKNALMASLSNTLLNCFKGRISTVAADNNAEVKVAETADKYTVTLTAKKAQTRGYSKIVLTYRKSDGLLMTMEMEEFSGITNLYTMSGAKRNI